MNKSLLLALLGALTAVIGIIMFLQGGGQMDALISGQKNQTTLNLSENQSLQLQLSETLLENYRSQMNYLAFATIFFSLLGIAMAFLGHYNPPLYCLALVILGILLMLLIPIFNWIPGILFVASGAMLLAEGRKN